MKVHVTFEIEPEEVLELLKGNTELLQKAMMDNYLQLLNPTKKDKSSD